jgi:MFS transporter
LWAAFSVSAAGSGIGAGALPLVAVLVLRASAAQVSVLLAVSGAASAVIALPIGAGIERRRKRPVMIAADLARFAALGSVPAAAALGMLSFAQLFLAGVVQTVAAIAFNAASGAHLKSLMPPALLMDANSRFETAIWVSQAGGPPVGGALISFTGTTTTMAVDAATFLLSALGVRRLRSPEPTPPAQPAARRIRPDLISGWRYIFAHRGLRALFLNAMIFGGPVMLAASLLAVLMLRNLRLSPQDYGLALGLPCLGGIAGSRLAPRLTRRFGQQRVLLAAGVLRSPWLLLLPLAKPGAGGLALIVTAETCLLLAAGVFNPSFGTYRMLATSDGFMARVGASWAVSSKVSQPAFIALGGLLTIFLSIPATLTAAGFVCLASALLLPWRAAPAAALGELGEGDVEVVHHAGGDHPHEERVPGGGEPADAVGVGPDAGPHHRQEARHRRLVAVLAEKQPQPARPAGEVSEALGRDHVLGVQRHPAERGERQVPLRAHRAGHVPVDEPRQAAIAPDGVVWGGVVVPDDQPGPPLASEPPDGSRRNGEVGDRLVVPAQPAGHLDEGVVSVHPAGPRHSVADRLTVDETEDLPPL